MTAFGSLDLGVFSSPRVMYDHAPVLLVSHEQDGSWQFVSSEEQDASECMFVHIEHILERDPSLEQLAELPLGWKAWRWSPEDEWIREVTPDDQPST